MPAVIVVAVLQRIISSGPFQDAVASVTRRERGATDDAVDALADESGSSLVASTIRGTIVLAVLTGVTWVIAQLVARQLTVGDEGTDETQVAVIMGGREFYGHAQQLRSMTAITVMGGLSLDLQDVTLDPAGAKLDVRTFLAGVEVRLPPTWRVEVEQDAAAGALDLDIEVADELPPDAPVLRVRAMTRLGGGLISIARG